jgi:hypothetical protein
VYYAKYCYKDGTILQDAPTCQCGQFLGKYDSFCPICGTKVPDTPEQKAADLYAEFCEHSGHSEGEDIEQREAESFDEVHQEERGRAL